MVNKHIVDMTIVLVIGNANFHYHFIPFQLKQLLRNLTRPNTGENTVREMSLKLLVEVSTEVCAWELLGIIS